jgi:DmsE family decaheme c-type cytochrome
MTLRPQVLKHLFLFTMVATLGGILAGSPNRLPAQDSPQKGADSQSGSINNEDCALCHDDLAKAFDQNPHAVLEKSPKFNFKNSCEKCHGPGQAHASNDGDKTKIIAFKGSDAKTYNKQCLACHQKDHELSGFKPGSLHAKSGLACSDCHAIHSSAHFTRLLKQSANSLCLSCHIQRRADFAKPYHHRVPENAMRCTDCHQPHGGLDHRQIRTTASGELPCLRCHSEKSGPFVFEHAPLRIRDCSACHEPHGSNNPKMLIRSSVQYLCLECHSKSANVLTSQPPSFHDLRSPRYQSCTTCHVKIHGSNSSPIFLR